MIVCRNSTRTECMSWLQSVWDLNFHFQDIPLPSLTILPEMFLATAAWETKELAAYSLPSALYHETLKRLSRGHYAFRRDRSTYRVEWKDVFSKLLISSTYQLITGLNVWQLSSCWLEDFFRGKVKESLHTYGQFANMVFKKLLRVNTS